MEYKVKVRYVRMGRRKLSKLFPGIKGKYVQHALANLKVHPQKASKVLQGAINSGVSNAVFVNREINPDSLWVKEARVDQGPSLKRIRPRARGSADRINKPMAHLMLVLTDEQQPVKPRKKKGVGLITEEMEKELAEKRAKLENKSADEETSETAESKAEELKAEETKPAQVETATEEETAQEATEEATGAESTDAEETKE